jgi:protein phosphatase
MEWAAKTHIGKIRDNNEDSFYIDEKNNCMFIVADGMGGHNAGEVASKMAIDVVSKFIEDEWNNTEILNDFEIYSLIRKAIEKANNKIYERSLFNEDCDGMGTTITIAIILNNKIYLGHIGDSRAYILRNNELMQLTEDHTLVSELLKNGSITEIEAKNHPKKNIITKALGTNLNAEPDISSKEIYDEDVIILCTDGLTNIIDNDEIKKSFIEHSNLQNACDYLVDLANNRGGYDNITIIAIRYRCS